MMPIDSCDLIQPSPDAIWAAAAERALREGDLDVARLLVDRVKWDADPLLLADLADMRVDRARGELAAAAPHGFLQVAARHQAADVAEEGDGKLELLGA